MNQAGFSGYMRTIVTVVWHICCSTVSIIHQQKDQQCMNPAFEDALIDSIYGSKFFSVTVIVP
jgi:hypothetical protein